MDSRLKNISVKSSKLKCNVNGKKNTGCVKNKPNRVSFYEYNKIIRIKNAILGRVKYSLGEYFKAHKI